MKKEAKLYKLSNNKARCNLCPHRCVIEKGDIGICGVRQFDGDKLCTLVYGLISSKSSDPIEKKPLYHFYPRTNAMSYGSIGCNFKCEHCQNYSISMASPSSYSHLEEMSPKKSVEIAKKRNCAGMAYTYNEPTIWFEFVQDSAKIAKEEGLYTVYITNGYMTKEAINEISPYLDAVNIDIKAFNGADFYKDICCAEFGPVKRTCEEMSKKGIHIEITYLIIPDLNDEKEEIKKLSAWVKKKLGTNTPIHFTRFHPMHKMEDVNPTTIDSLENAHDTAKKEGLNYVYIGNVPGHEYNNTYCPNCGNEVISRTGFNVNIVGIDEKRRCTYCNEKIFIIDDKK